MTDLSLQGLRLFVAGAAAIGVGLGLSWLLDLVGLIGGRLLASRWRSWRNVERAYTATSEILTEDQLYGTDRVNWPLVALAGGCAGLLVTWLLFSVQPGPLTFSGLLAAGLPLLQKRYQVRQAKRRLRHQVRTFITDLQLVLRLDHTLGPALEHVSRVGGQGILYERLRLHVQRRLGLSSPQAVIERLAEELRSPELKDLLLRLQAAQRGADTYEHALGRAADEIVAELTAEAEQHVEGAPSRLLVPMCVMLFMPILVLGLYPLANRVIEGLAGTGAF